jgi:hypothetical protein
MKPPCKDIHQPTIGVVGRVQQVTETVGVFACAGRADGNVAVPRISGRSFGMRIDHRLRGFTSQAIIFPVDRSTLPFDRLLYTVRKMVLCPAVQPESDCGRIRRCWS